MKLGMYLQIQEQEETVFTLSQRKKLQLLLNIFLLSTLALIKTTVLILLVCNFSTLIYFINNTVLLFNV